MKMLIFVLIATQSCSSLPLHPTGRPTGCFKALLSDDVASPGKFCCDPIPRTHYYTLFEMKLIFLPSSFVVFRGSSFSVVFFIRWHSLVFFSFAVSSLILALAPNFSMLYFLASSLLFLVLLCVNTLSSQLSFSFVLSSDFLIFWSGFVLSSSFLIFWFGFVLSSSFLIFWSRFASRSFCCFAAKS